METTTCPKCNGLRSITFFAHVEDGVCFECNGRGVVAKKAPTASPACDMTPADALSQLRAMYSVAKVNGAVWFEDADVTGLGMPAVEFFAALLDAPKRAQVVAAFEALQG